MLSVSFLRTCLAGSLTLCLSGCFHPGMYYGNPYGQPMYAPPRTINPGQPGSLYIPESGSEYVPGGYDADPDDFRQSDENKTFFDSDDNVPLPNDRRPYYNDEEDIPSSSLSPDRSQMVTKPVSVTRSAPVEFSFDTKDYRWLRGVLRVDSSTGTVSVLYSQAGRDRYRGELTLDATTQQIGELQDGDPVDVQGLVETSATDRDAVYRVTSIRRQATRLAANM